MQDIYTHYEFITAMNHPKIQAYILTHNRHHMAMEALNSVLHQDYPNLHVVLSDNSTNDLTEQEALSIASPLFAYIRRSPSLTAEEHFRKVFSEISCEYFLLLHDDDILLPGAIRKLISAMELFPDAAAIGSNAYCMYDSQKSNRTFLKRKRGYMKPSRYSFLLRYLRFEEIAPFPSYLYRKSKVGSKTLDFRRGGKYSDVAFLLDLYQEGEIVWVLEPLMYYRIHTKQDSSSFKYFQIRSLIKFIESQNIFPKTSVSLQYFKARSFYSFWRTCLIKGTAQKHLNIFMRIFARLIWIRPLFFMPRILKCLAKYQLF